MATHFVRGSEHERGQRAGRGNQLLRGNTVERGDKISRPGLTRGIDNLVIPEEEQVMANILTMAGKEVGSHVVVFPDNIAGGSFIPGTIVRFIQDTLVQISVGTVVIQDGAWEPVDPFVAGDQVFVPIDSINTFV